MEEEKISKGDATKEKIITTSLKLFSEQGYYGTSMREVAKEAGISLGLTYNYFKNKEALLGEILSQHGERLQNFVTPILEQAKEVSKEELIHLFFCMVEENENYFRLIWSLMLQPQVLSHQKSFIDNIYQLTFHLSQMFILSERENATDFEVKDLMNSVLGVIINYLVNRDFFSIDHMKDILMKRITIDH